MYHGIPTVGHGMYLEGLTVCVNYADFLEETLCRNLDHFDEFAVVTACDDKATQAVCERHGVICVKSDMHREDPLDRFNKGLMINLGLAHLRNRGWLLHLDADIVLPDRLRFVLNKSRLDEECLYGADRMNVVGRANWERLKQSPAYQRQYHHRYLVCPAAARLGSRLLHNEYGYCPIGYFQLWHSRQRKPLSLLTRIGGAFGRLVCLAVAGCPADSVARRVRLSSRIRAGPHRRELGRPGNAALREVAALDFPRRPCKMMLAPLPCNSFARNSHDQPGPLFASPLPGRRWLPARR